MPEPAAARPPAAQSTLQHSDAIIIGAGLAGLVAASELVDVGKRVTIVEQEPPASFGGGGMHGYRSLEGTFLGGCLFSGRVAGRAIATLSE